MVDNLNKTEQQWQEQLGPEAYAVCRLAATERPGTGKYWKHSAAGTYVCACCAAPLFASTAKYDSGCGWPSFFAAISETAVAERPDDSHGMQRTEILCVRCDSHLGHVFPDGPRPTGLRYCVNSLSLDFVAD